MVKVKTRDIQHIVGFEMSQDTGASHEDNVAIISLYEGASEDTKHIIDEIFRHLCGYSLDTILTEDTYENYVSEEN